MIKNVELSIEFWPEAEKADAYIRNRVSTGLMINENSTIFMKAFIEIKSFIDHIRVWGCKCYVFVNSKFFTRNRKNKFMNKNKFCVFFDYLKKIDTQYLMWISDREFIKHHKIVFAEKQKWKNDDLNLSIRIENILSVKRSMRRSPKSISASDSALIKSAEPINEINLQSAQSIAVIVFVFFNKFNLNEEISNVDQCIDQAENAIIETKNSSKIVSPI